MEKEERTPVTLEQEMIRLEDTSTKTEEYRQELLEKMMTVARNMDITIEELKDKGKREAITAAVKMASDLINDTESAQHKRIGAKARMRDVINNDKIADQGIEILKAMNMTDSFVDAELPIAPIEYDPQTLTDEEKLSIPVTILKTDPNDVT